MRLTGAEKIDSGKRLTYTYTLYFEVEDEKKKGVSKVELC